MSAKTIPTPAQARARAEQNAANLQRVMTARLRAEVIEMINDALVNEVRINFNFPWIATPSAALEVMASLAAKGYKIDDGNGAAYDSCTTRFGILFIRW